MGVGGQGMGHRGHDRRDRALLPAALLCFSIHSFCRAPDPFPTPRPRHVAHALVVKQQQAEERGRQLSRLAGGASSNGKHAVRQQLPIQGPHFASAHSCVTL